MRGNEKFQSMLNNKFKDILQEREIPRLFVSVIAPRGTSREKLSEYFNQCKSVCTAVNLTMEVSYVYAQPFSGSTYLHRMIDCVETSDIVVVSPGFHEYQDLVIFVLVAKYYKKAIMYIDENLASDVYDIDDTSIIPNYMKETLLTPDTFIQKEK